MIDCPSIIITIYIYIYMYSSVLTCSSVGLLNIILHVHVHVVPFCLQTKYMYMYMYSLLQYAPRQPPWMMDETPAHARVILLYTAPYIIPWRNLSNLVVGGACLLHVYYMWSWDRANGTKYIYMYPSGWDHLAGAKLHRSQERRLGTKRSDALYHDGDYPPSIVRRVPLIGDKQTWSVRCMMSLPALRLKL